MSYLDPYLPKIQGFEGYTPRAAWDYQQYTNGYGTRAAYPGEVIDKATAAKRFSDEINKANSIVESLAPNAPDGVKAALTSLTFNSGDKWTRSGLASAVKAGDLDNARKIFLQYNRAGGQVNDGLVSRRNAEASWFNQPASPTQDGGAFSVADATPNILKSGYGRESGPGYNVASATPSPTPSSAEQGAPGAFSGLSSWANLFPKTAANPSGGILGGIGALASAFGGSQSKDDGKASQAALDQAEHANALAINDDQQRAQQALETIMQRKLKQPASLASAFGGSNGLA